MEFGEWVSNIRQERGLDVRAFAKETGIDSSTVSRTENQRTQTSIYTAYKIIQGLRVSVFELAKTLTDLEFPSLKEDYFVPSSNILILEDVDRFVAYYKVEQDKGAEQLVNYLNDLSSSAFGMKRTGRYQEHRIEVDRHDIERLLFKTSLFRSLEMEYPTKINPEIILETYKQRGALMISDVETYTNNIRSKARRISSASSFNTGGVLPVGSLRTTGHMGSGAILERTKLSDVIEFDIKTEQSGKVIGMYWDACKLYDKFNSPKHGRSSFYVASEREILPTAHEDWEIQLAVVYIAIYRWYQFLGKERRFFEIADRIWPF